ncbi:hypothetical protein [Neobacillus cucumis]|jgi:hypothetical protein|uniref:hypothetical protein n=1 Tax=Neobacillus cucumis TaxID=1740721 RepID=UPI002E1E55A8|nr:hypothetical protein [Neobacillus cucumis]
MLDKLLLAKNTVYYSDKQLDAISRGFCPNCLPKHSPYRILGTYYDENLKINLYHIKCDNLVQCEWDDEIPATRVDPGLEDFFNS